MRPITLKSAARQVADHLREEIQRHGLTGGLPGPRTLAEQLGVNHKTVESALDMMEEEGLLVAQGPGRRRKINPQFQKTEAHLRLQMLIHNRRDSSTPLLIEMRHRLREAGHAVTVGSKRVGDYSTKPESVIEWIENNPADGWLLHAAPEGLLRWFTERSIPVFAIGGGRHGLPLAGCGPDKTPAMREAVERLVGLGHRHIVMLGRKERLDAAGPNYAKAFLDELSRHDLPSGKANLPVWNNQPSGFQRCLQAVLADHQASALILDEAPLFIAAQQFLARQGLSAPRHLSMICTQYDPCLDWCRPEVAHFQWDGSPMMRRVLQWAHHMACDKPDLNKCEIPASYVDGETVGPPISPMVARTAVGK